MAWWDVCVEPRKLRANRVDGASKRLLLNMVLKAMRLWMCARGGILKMQGRFNGLWTPPPLVHIVLKLHLTTYVQNRFLLFAFHVNSQSSCLSLTQFSLLRCVSIHRAIDTHTTFICRYYTQVFLLHTSFHVDVHVSMFVPSILLMLMPTSLQHICNS